MKKILPISLEPYIRAYTHHGYLHSIISSSDKVNYDENESVAKVKVKNYSSYNWNIERDQLKCEIEEHGIINAYCNKWNTGMNATFWRTCQCRDEIEICVEKQLLSNVWGSIFLFLTNSEQSDLFDANLFKIRLGVSSIEGIYFSNGNNSAEGNAKIYIKPQLPLKLKLVREMNQIYIECSDGSFNKEKFLITEINESEQLELNRIGFSIALGNSSYYEWLFSNYIQIYSDVENSMPIDYLCNVHKNWKTYTTNYFIDFSFVTKEEIDEDGYSVIDYIEKQIKRNRYVETLINDKLHNNSNNIVPSYQDLLYGNGYNDNDVTPFFHNDLIYGFDSDNRYFYVLYYRNGKEYTSVMTYDDFLSKKNELDDRWFYIMKYNPGGEVNRVSCKHLAQLFKEYREGENISFYEPQFEQKCNIGINCLQYFCTEAGIESVISDIRIIYIFYEHSLCNRDRVEYLIAKRQINQQYCKQLLHLANEEKVSLEIIRNKIVMNMITGKNETKDIQDKLYYVYQIEKEFVDLMIKALDMSL